MASLPDHTRRVLERLLDRYCARICPPEFEHQVVLGWRIDGTAAVLHELRRICGIPGTQRPVDVARLRWSARRGTWSLHCRTAAGTGARWHRYPGTREERNVAVLLRALDADPLGRFWPRVNGASLRWCSSRGRCADCDVRYCAALGAAAGPGAPGHDPGFERHAG